MGGGEGKGEGGEGKGEGRPETLQVKGSPTSPRGAGRAAQAPLPGLPPGICYLHHCKVRTLKLHLSRV